MKVRFFGSFEMVTYVIATRIASLADNKKRDVHTL